jgi:acetyl-CoA carboxylase biotin carboxyl carrier protein
MNIKEIKEMINLMNENNLYELEIEKDGTRIKLKKGAATVSPQEQASAVPVFTGQEKAIKTQGEAKAQLPAAKEAAANRIEIKAPMVGTFYRAPTPSAPSFVQVNEEIEPGQVICIIEAMKLMNEIKSEIKGKILDILVDNAEPIEFGQPLFIVEPL